MASKSPLQPSKHRLRPHFDSSRGLIRHEIAIGGYPRDNRIIVPKTERPIVSSLLTQSNYPLDLPYPLHERTYSQTFYNYRTMDYDEYLGAGPEYNVLEPIDSKLRVRSRNRLPFGPDDFASNPPTPEQVAAEIDRRQSDILKALFEASPIPGTTLTLPTDRTTSSDADCTTAIPAKKSANGISKRYDESFATASQQQSRPTENILVAVMTSLLNDKTTTTRRPHVVAKPRVPLNSTGRGTTISHLKIELEHLKSMTRAQGFPFCVFPIGGCK